MHQTCFIHTSGHKTTAGFLTGRRRARPGHASRCLMWDLSAMVFGLHVVHDREDFVRLARLSRFLASCSTSAGVPWLRALAAATITAARAGRRARAPYQQIRDPQHEHHGVRGGPVRQLCLHVLPNGTTLAASDVAHRPGRVGRGAWRAPTAHCRGPPRDRAGPPLPAQLRVHGSSVHQCLRTPLVRRVASTP